MMIFPTTRGFFILNLTPATGVARNDWWCQKQAVIRMCTRMDGSVLLVVLRWLSADVAFTAPLGLNLVSAKQQCWKENKQNKSVVNTFHWIYNWSNACKKWFLERKIPMLRICQKTFIEIIYRKIELAHFYFSVWRCYLKCLVVYP